MKAEELKIGDFVELATDDGTFVKVEVVELRKESLLGLIDDKFMDELQYHEVDPIPITEDLLYEFGFYPSMEDERIYEYRYGGHYVVHVQKNGEFINLIDETHPFDDEDYDCDLIAMIRPIWDKLAVHNLQHFLTENEIDIKIKV